MGFHTPMKANVYRVQDGQHQRHVIALTSDQAVAALNLSTPRAAQCFFQRKATTKDFSRPRWVVSPTLSKR